MKSIIALLSLTFVGSAFGIEPSSWIYLPDDTDEYGDPWRIVLREDGVVLSQTLFAGVRSTNEGKYKDKGSEIRCRFSRKNKFVLSVSAEALELIDDESGRTYIFKKVPGWDSKFDEAPQVPRTKEEAINTLLKLYPEGSREEFANAKREDLIGYHFGFGMTIRNSFGLWGKGSPLLKDLGGGHPDDASMILIEAFWERLQEMKKQNQSVDTTAVSAPH